MQHFNQPTAVAMRLVVIVLGFVLIAVGLFFAFREPGKDWAKGAGGRFSLEGPSWLLLVGIGVVVVVFGAAFDFDDDGDSSANTTATTAATTTAAPNESSTTTDGATTSSESVDPVTGCEVTIANRLATIHEEPDEFSTEVSSVPAGTYPVVEITEVEFVQQMQRWFRIDVDNQTGWIRDSTFNIASKTDACF